MHIPQKQVELFCGTGGVGKTTIATARALNLATQKKKVLLITIDPAKRLKQILNLADGDNGEIHTVKGDLFQVDESISFDAMLMSPGATLNRIAKERGLEKEFQSRIIKTLSRPYAGMNEIMSIIEVQYQIEKKHYDTIILDTPPGNHFIDFLESSQKIRNFFDKSFLEIFEFLGKKTGEESKSKVGNLFTKVVSTGVKKLLEYLENVTGADFVSEFIDSVLALYRSRDSFLKALSFHDDLKRRSFSNWFLVTAVDQQKLYEAQNMRDEAKNHIHEDLFLIMNKCHDEEFHAWQPKPGSTLEQFKVSMVQREEKLTSFASKNYSFVLKFNELTDPSPVLHVKKLSQFFN